MAEINIQCKIESPRVDTSRVCDIRINKRGENRLETITVYCKDEVAEKMFKEIESILRKYPIGSRTDNLNISSHEVFGKKEIEDLEHDDQFNPT
jgi:phosphoribosylaminoimidazole-succinocarboxamide synthase